jgi:predicted transcriptional regulator
MTTTTRDKASAKRSVVAPAKTKDTVVSIRLSNEILAQVDELAAEMERSRASVLARAVREYVEHEYGRLVDLREAERELDAGKGIPHEQMTAWIKDLRAGKGRPAKL